MEKEEQKNRQRADSSPADALESEALETVSGGFIQGGIVKSEGDAVESVVDGEDKRGKLKSMGWESL